MLLTCAVVLGSLAAAPPDRSDCEDARPVAWLLVTEEALPAGLTFPTRHECEAFLRFWDGVDPDLRCYRSRGRPNL